MVKVQTGYLNFKNYRTYYRIVGDKSSYRPPLVLLHGGPGSTHNYFEVLDELANTGHQLIMYDQLGCGKSSHPQNSDLWSPQIWVHELINLREKLHLNQIHLLGQSWGGMLAIIYLCDYQPQGIQSLILASTLSSAALWAKEQHRLIKLMSRADQLAILKAEQTGDYQDSAYLRANMHFMQQHASDDKSEQYFPKPQNKGTQSYLAAWGPNEYTPTGTLKNYDYTKRLNHIKIPTLITSGTDDLCTPLIAKTMFDNLPRAQWHLFSHSRHMAFIDEHNQYLNVLKSWLAKN